jgi:GT2 family glycosyltransferase
MIHKKYLKERLRSAPPTISIVTPSYNQGKFIERTLRSVLDQAYPNLEYIIQDGASSDETMQIVQKYGDRLKHYESVIDSGQTNALNLGFRHATGEIMAYLNSDDLLLPGSLTYVANYFLQHPDVDVLYGHRIVVDEYDQEVGRWVLPTHNNEVLSWADYIPQETLFWRRSVWQKAGGTMDESFRFAMDWDLILRLREAKARFARVPRYLGAFRIHPHQKTSAQMTEIGTQEMNRLRERCNGRPVSHQEISQQTRPYMIRHILYSRFIHLIERFQKNTVSVSFL